MYAHRASITFRIVAVDVDNPVYAVPLIKRGGSVSDVA